MGKLVLCSLLSVKLERWLQLMLKWSPQERGKDPEAAPNDCFSQLGLILQLKVHYSILFCFVVTVLFLGCMSNLFHCKEEPVNLYQMEIISKI